MEYIVRTEPVTDDLLPEIYADWLEQVDAELIIELAEKWHREQMIREIEDLRKSLLMAIEAKEVQNAK